MLHFPMPQLPSKKSIKKIRFFLNFFRPFYNLKKNVDDN